MSANPQIFRCPPVTTQLDQEARDIERRRQRNDERSVRVLDAKQRKFGIDTNALAEQIRDQQERAQLEIDRDDHYDSMANGHARILKEMESVHNMEDRERAIEMNNFRHQQAKEKRRRDLEAMSEVTTKIDKDTTFLHFPGEDLQKPERTKAHQMMQQDWLSQQVQLLQDKQAFEASEEANFQAQQNAILDVRYQVEENAARLRRQRNEDQAAFNHQLVLEKRRRAAVDQEHNASLDASEINSQLKSKFLNEGVGSMDGPKNFKGFTTAQRQRILDEQAVQIAELRAKRDAEAEDEQAYDLYQEKIRQTVVGIDREKAANDAANQKQLLHERRVQQSEKEARCPVRCLVSAQSRILYVRALHF